MYWKEEIKPQSLPMTGPTRYTLRYNRAMNVMGVPNCVLTGSKDNSPYEMEPIPVTVK